MKLVAADIGGTNARFAVVEVDAGGLRFLGEPVSLRRAEFAGLPEAWAAFRETFEGEVPTRASIAIAVAVRGDILEMPNSPWVIDRRTIADEIGVEDLMMMNDFEAVAHSVGALEAGDLLHLFGPDRPLPEEGVISVIGAGTGLGVAYVLRGKAHYHAVATEGGHGSFAPLDDFERELEAALSKAHGRVSVERVASGPAIRPICEALAAREGVTLDDADDRTLWMRTLAGESAMYADALERFCRMLGAASGDIALVQGAHAVVLAGGVGQRIGARLGGAAFADRFRAKGRYVELMERLPVKLITHDEPGLLGAAAAYVRARGGQAG
ncbi:MAG: ROK family protein [Hyphomonadaceae bacterium]